MKPLLTYIALFMILLISFQRIHAQTDTLGTSFFFTDFSNGTLPEDWKSSVPGYNASVREQAFELSISKSTGSDHYTLGNLYVKHFDLRTYMTIRYRAVDTIQVAVKIFGIPGSVSPREIFTLPSSVDWTRYTFNLSALASESWGYDLDSIQLVFQPENQEYSGSFSMDEIMVGDAVNGKTFTISLDQAPEFSVDLSNDTTIQAPATLNLDAGNPGKTYLWSTGETTRTITVDTTGIYWVRVIGSHNCVHSDTIGVTLDIQDNIPRHPDDSGMRIYPNPAQTSLQIEMPDLMMESLLEIRDISGRVMDSRAITGEQSSIDISHYPPGLYFIGIPGKSAFVKLVKMNFQ